MTDKLETAITQFGEFAERVSDDLLHYKIRAARAERIAEDRQLRIDEKDVEIECNNELIRRLEKALQLFIKQWNACGPNSDFGRYFSNVRDAANKALEGRQ